MAIKNLIPGRRTAERRGEEHPLAALQQDINRLFDNTFRGFGAPFAGWLSERVGIAEPRVDVAETDKAVEVSVELPGMDEKDLDVSISDDVLTVKGEKKTEREEKKKGYYLAERSYGSIFRSIPLPAGVDSAKATAEFKKGVLTVTVPKTAEAAAKVKKIEIKKG